MRTAITTFGWVDGWRNVPNTGMAKIVFVAKHVRSDSEACPTPSPAVVFEHYM
jgi:hypothetical protein